MKKLLPKKAVEILKFVSAKNIREYIDEDNMPVDWGGRDDYVFKFESETRHERQDDEVILKNGDSRQPANNNSDEQENLNLLHRKVSPVSPLTRQRHVERINHFSSLSFPTVAGNAFTLGIGAARGCVH